MYLFIFILTIVLLSIEHDIDETDRVCPSIILTPMIQFIRQHPS